MSRSIIRRKPKRKKLTIRLKCKNANCPSMKAIKYETNLYIQVVCKKCFVVDKYYK